jgi:hypothetical protein
MRRIPLSMGDVVMWVVAVGIVTWMSLRTIRDHRKARQAYPEVEYDEASAESTAPEKLRRPKTELELTIEHISVGTSVSIPFITRSLEVCCHLFGWFMLGIAIFGVVQSLFWFEPFILIIAIPLAFLMGWTFLQMGRRGVRIEFRQDNVIFVVRFGSVLLKKFSFPWQQEIEFDGQYQSVLTMINEQKEPDYKITITRPRIWFLPWSKSFLLACNQSQGSWIVGALRSWADRKNDSEM